jgi:hypothetical protein
MPYEALLKVWFGVRCTGVSAHPDIVSPSQLPNISKSRSILRHGWQAPEPFAIWFTGTVSAGTNQVKKTSQSDDGFWQGGELCQVSI